ncbi:peroxisomal short-chain alcohol dehydrogenase [Fusarium circinatum]|uniref:Peroxisomal short-chain alcohol dehydrogenase n=1 Tax=Fusarium circinatum TaxID=48490 RepID=A0A8H5WL29_FUSCI|nr:peroxisomal short-chain alcohol dehydrogenase [Fusarium circinatum]
MGKQREENARPDLLNVMDIINISRATDVTKTVHSEPYDAISTTNPNLSQAGKTILITGGGTTIGNAIGCSFFVVNVSSSITHNYMQAVTTKLAAYAFNKSCGTMLFQMVAKDTPVEEMQITSMHPGLIWSPEWVKMGFNDDVGFDNIALQGNFAVWLATPNAAFLHGRFAWASWDINELSQGPIRERIEEDPYYLKITIRGANP